MKRAFSLFAATTLASTFAWAQSSAPVAPVSLQDWPAGARAVQVRYRQQGQTIQPLGEGLPAVAPVQRSQMLEPVPAPQPDATPGYGVPVMGNRGGVQVIPESEVGRYQDNVPMEGVSRPPAVTPSRRMRRSMPTTRATNHYGCADGLVTMPYSQASESATTSESYGPQQIPMMGDVVIPPSDHAGAAQVAPTGIDLPGPTFDPNTMPAELEGSAAREGLGGSGIQPLGSEIIPASVVASQSLPIVSVEAAPTANVSGAFTTPAEALQRGPQPPMMAGPVGSSVLPMPQQEYAQMPSSGEAENGPLVTPESYAASLRQVSMEADGTCQTVHPGDIVHFTLRIENVEEANHVFTHLQLALNGHAHASDLEFPIPQHDAIGGGGIGQRDPMSARVYHFSLVVPEVQSGFYRTTGIDVRASFARNSADPGVGVALDRRSREQVRSYCLAVSGGGGGRRPEVTDFHGGPVERAAVSGSVFR